MNKTMASAYTDMMNNLAKSAVAVPVHLQQASRALAWWESPDSLLARTSIAQDEGVLSKSHTPEQRKEALQQIFADGTVNDQESEELEDIREDKRRHEAEGDDEDAPEDDAESDEASDEDSDEEDQDVQKSLTRLATLSSDLLAPLNKAMDGKMFSVLKQDAQSGEWQREVNTDNPEMAESAVQSLKQSGIKAVVVPVENQGGAKMPKKTALAPVRESRPTDNTAPEARIRTAAMCSTEGCGGRLQFQDVPTGMGFNQMMGVCPNCNTSSPVQRRLANTVDMISAEALDKKEALWQAQDRVDMDALMATPRHLRPVSKSVVAALQDLSTALHALR